MTSEEARDSFDRQLIQTPNDKVRCLQFFRRMRGRDGHHLHAGRMRSFNPNMRILENDTAARAHSKALRRFFEDLRVRFPLLHILG